MKMLLDIRLHPKHVKSNIVTRVGYINPEPFNRQIIQSEFSPT